MLKVKNTATSEECLQWAHEWTLYGQGKIQWAWGQQKLPKVGEKTGGEQEEKILMEENTQKLWYISKGISITAVPGGKKRERRHI